MKNDIYNQPKSVLDAINEILANEGKSSTGYELYHRDFSSAMKHAYDFAKKKFGIEIDPSEIDDKVATGPRKPSSGKTNRYRLMGKDKNGKTKGVQIQVANLDNKKYELNMYKEEVELEEKMDPTDHVKKKGDKFCVYNADGTIAKEFDNKEDADKYAIDNHDKLMATAKKEEVELDEMRQPYAVVDTANDNKVVGTASDEKGAKSIISTSQLPPMKIKDKKTLKIMKSKKKQMIGQPFKEEVELDEARWEYTGNTNYKVGGNLRYDDKLDYKLSKADANILNKYMKQAKNDAARSKVWAMFWDSKETGDKAKGPVKAIAFAKKAIKEEVELDEKVEYVEYKFKNKNDAMSAKKMLDAVQLMSFDINDDNISGGELAVDSGKKDMTKYHKEIMKKYRPKVLTQESIDELFMSARPSSKDVKNAINIANKKAGNMTGAIREIEKIRKGLSDYPEVKAALRKANEELDISLEEGKMSPDQIEKLKKGYESLRGKKISAEMGMKISRELEKLDKSAAMEIAKADIPFVSTIAINKLMMNFNMSGSAIRKLIGESVEELVEEIEGLKKKSEKSGIAYGILKKVYDRGMAAWKSGHRPGTTPQQWAFARVNSFITGGGARKADNDLWSKHKGKSPKKEGTTMKRFGTFMNEATGGMKMIGAAGELEKYSKKSGGIDKKDFMKAVKLMRQGMTDKLVDFTMDLDTEPREKIVDIVANHIGVKATEKMFKVRFNNRSEEVKLDEGKMKDLAIDVDNVYKGMMKNKMMKAFADKFKKDVSKSMNIRKSLEKILPDYVPGKDIQSLMASSCMKGEELSPKQKKIDLNKNGKVDGADLAKLRKKKNEDMGFELCDTCETPKECMAEETCLAGPVDESVSIDFAELIENSDKKDAKEMADVIKELDPKVKSKELKQKVYDMAMEKYKNKSRATKIANMIK